MIDIVWMFYDALKLPITHTIQVKSQINLQKNNANKKDINELGDFAVT